jgi:hypothetical protein
MDPPRSGSTVEPRDWAHSANYYAMTVANSFHSRRAYLHLGGANASTGENSSRR